MRQVRRWMMVLLCCAAAAARGEAPPDARQQEARTAFDEAGRLWDAGRYADAIARGEHALVLSEAVLGGSHPDVARCLDLLGLHYLLQGNHARAEPLYARALAILEATLGKHHPLVAEPLCGWRARPSLARQLTGDGPGAGRPQPMGHRAGGPVRL